MKNGLLRKGIVGILSATMMMGLVACGGASSSNGASTESAASDGATHIYVLTAPEDHGWTGAVATFAKEKIEEVNGEGKYSAELITSASAASSSLL